MKRLVGALLGLLLGSASALAQGGPLPLSCPSYTNGSPCMVGNAQWHLESSSNSWSVTNVNPTTLRFEIRYGDHRPGEYSTSVNRVEVNEGQLNPWPGGQAFTTQFDLNVLPGSPSTVTFLSFYQLAYPFQGIGNWLTSPDLEFGLLPGDHLTLIGMRGCPPQSNVKQINWPKGLWTDPLPVQRGTTHTFRVTMFFNPKDANAWVKMWRDGVQIADYSGVLGCATYRSSFSVVRHLSFGSA